MKARISIVATIAVLLAALVFLAKRPKGFQDNSSPQANKNAVSEDNSTSSDSVGNARKETITPSATSFVRPTTGTNRLEAIPGSPSESQGNRASASVPVIGGSKTFIPKVQPSLPEPQAAIELDKVRLMLRDYRTLYHENPVGTNAEIMKAVMGGNPKEAQLGPPEGQGLSANGELLDRWGMPYFFHQLSSTLMEIRSAGPDKILWTSDDLVTK